jgi:putative restriction endonuclease
VDRETDGLIRIAAFTRLQDLQDHYGDVVPFLELQKGFAFRDSVVRFLGPQGIFIPKGMTIPLSITTAPEKPGKPRPYEDEVGADGLLRYRYRGSDVGHRENLGLRIAMTDRIPLIYFWGLVPGQYSPTWPAMVEADNPSLLTFTVGFDAVNSDVSRAEPGEDARRAYVTQEVMRRVHQARFRQRVLAAYKCSCAICQLRHSELLDAAHILPDNHPRGEPVVPNGISLCKIHHAAFDRNIIGIRPDLVVEVRADVLKEIDGPMLRFGIQGCNGQAVRVPSRIRDRPDSELLGERFEMFRQAI